MSSGCKKAAGENPFGCSVQFSCNLILVSDSLALGGAWSRLGGDPLLSVMSIVV
jgi:hypothetical protein